MLATARHHIANGRPGTIQTLAQIERLVARGKRNPALLERMKREALTGHPERNPDSEIAAVTNWVKSRFRYTHDPRGVEMVQAAEITLGLSPASPGPHGFGDCDDAVVAIRALLEGIGYATRSKVMGPHASRYTHIVAQVQHPKSKAWITIDPTAKLHRVGWEPPAAVHETYPGGKMSGSIYHLPMRPSYDARPLTSIYDRAPVGYQPPGFLGLSGSTHGINLNGHTATLQFMQKWGGGAVLKGSLVPPAGTIWRHDPNGMCGPHPCMDCPFITQHPWFVNQQGDLAFDHLDKFIWYKPPTYDPNQMGLWDVSGGVLQYLCWLQALDVQEGEIALLPPGYVDEGKSLAAGFVGARVHRMKRRAKQKVQRAKAVQIASGGLAVIATALTAGLLGPTTVAATATTSAGTTALGKLAIATGAGAAALERTAKRKLAKAGVKSAKIASMDGLVTNVAKVAKGEPLATTGDTRVDNVVRELRNELVDQADYANYQRLFTPQPRQLVSDAQEERGIGTTGLVVGGVAAVGVLGLITVLALRK